MIRCTSLPLVAALGALVAISTLLEPRAQAQDQAAIDKLIQMNKKALEDYDTLEWDSAKRTLLEALVTGKKSGLDNHPIMARTYVHLGAVYITGFKDRQKGLQSFARALEIDPSIRLSKAMATPELNDTFNEAAKQKGRGGGGGSSAAPAPPPPAPAATGRRRGPVMETEAEAEPAPRPSRRARESSDDESGEPDLPVRVNALDCPTPDDVPPDKTFTLRCAVASNLPVAKVFLLYREPGHEDYTAVEMEKTPKGWLQAKVPKKVVTGKSVQFYFEGRNAAGKPVVSNGRSDSPNLVLIREAGAAEEAEAAAPRSRSAEEEDENPLEERERTGPRLYLGRVDRSQVGLDTRFGKRKYWIGLGLGEGLGYVSGNFEARPDLQESFQPGFGWAGWGHFAGEFGYHLSPDFAVSIQTRNQYIYQKAFQKFTARGAQSVLARLLFFTKQSQLRFYGALNAGGGEGFRFVLYPDPDRPDFQDTIRGGPFIAGVGGGLYYESSKAVSIVLELNVLAGLPNFSVVNDINFALQINLY